MSTYYFFRNQAAVQATPQDTGNQPIKPVGADNPNIPPQSVSFQLDISGQGAISASAKLFGSNDVDEFNAGLPINWNDLGITLTANGNGTASNGAGSTGKPYALYGAYISAISGTNTLATCRMSA